MKIGRKQDEIILTDYETAFMAAHLHLSNFVQLTQHLRDATEAGTSENNKRASIIRAAAMHGVIVFSAICLEGAINYFGYANRVAYYKDIERTLSALNKWRVFSRLAGIEPVKEHILERIDLIFALRDRIVHSKPKSIELPQTKRVFMLHEAAYVINTLDHAFAAIGLDRVPEEGRMYDFELDGETRPEKDIWLL